MYIIINGGGKVGEYLATKLSSGRHDVAVIELSEKRLDRLTVTLPGKVLMVHGDGCDSVYQADAGAQNADIFVATTGSDDVNLVSCEIARLVFGVPRTIARVNSPKNEKIFRRMGIEAVSSTTVITRLIESEATAGAVHAIMSLTQGDLVLTEVSIPNPDALTKDFGEEPKGSRVADIRLPEGSLLVAVGRGESLEIVKGATILYPGDLVIVVHKEGLENEVKDILLTLQGGV
jgi:trk system potassium uptake protein TrkA